LGEVARETLKKVAGEFEGEVLAELQEGKEQSFAIIEAAKMRAQEAVSKILDMSVRQAEALKRQIIGAAELGARNSQLKVLEEAVSGVFSDAISQVSKMTGPRYEKALAGLIEEGIGVIGHNSLISCNSRDRKLVSVAVKKLKGNHAKPIISDKSIETIGGVVLITVDEFVRFDNTFEARLERLRPTLRKEIATVLTS